MAANRHSMPSASPSVPPAALLLTLPLYLQHQAHTVESLAPGETCSEHFLTPFSTKVRANIKTCPTFPHLPQNTAGLLKEAHSKSLQKGSTSIIYMKKHFMMEDFWAASLNSSSGILSFCWLLKDFPSKGTARCFAGSIWYYITKITQDNSTQLTLDWVQNWSWSRLPKWDSTAVLEQQCHSGEARPCSGWHR